MLTQETITATDATVERMRLVPCELTQANQLIDESVNYVIPGASIQASESETNSTENETFAY
jgi:hypothetical protein